MGKRAQSSTDKMVPHNAEAEQAVVGSLLIDPEAFYHVPWLRGGDFHDQRHAWVYEAVQALQEQRNPVDLVTVCDELERRERLEQIGGMAYLTHLVNVVPSAIHIETYGRIVERLAGRRRLLSVASDLARLAYQDDAELADTLAQADRVFTTALARNGHGRTFTASDLIGQVYDDAQLYCQNPIKDGETRYLDTGWPDLNKALGGWKTGLYIIIAVPHLGKSWFVLDAAANVASKGKRVLFFPLEMTGKQLVERLVLSTVRITDYDYQRGAILEEQWPVLAARLGQVGGWDLTIDEEAATLQQIRASILKHHREKPLDMVVIDPLGMIESPGAENRARELGIVSRSLKLLADDIGSPILVPHHISAKKVAERSNKRPMLSDPFETGWADIVADVVLGLYRDEFYNPETTARHIMEVLTLKDRLGGRTGARVDLFFSLYGELLSAERRAVPVYLEGVSNGNGSNGY